MKLLIFSATVFLMLNRFSISRRYLVEFRGGMSHQFFRVDELKDCISSVMQIDFKSHRLDISNAVSEPEYKGSHPICIYCNFPDANTAKLAVERSALIRSIVEVWGDASCPDDCSQQAISESMSLIAHSFPASNSFKENSWRVVFRRFGRQGKSGLDPAGKRQLLTVFSPVLQSLYGEVDLISPVHSLLYLEDWSSYHEEITLPVAQNDSVVNMDKVGECDLSYESKRSIFGRIVAEGPCVGTKFEVKNRPFIGTTTMDAISSHLAANAALVKPGDLVLDPFCGTGSLLLSSAVLGAQVVGSDVDGDTLGLLIIDKQGERDAVSEKSAPLVRYRDRSKNNRFKRNDGSSQLEKSVVDNFKFYTLGHKLECLLSMDVALWVHDTSNTVASIFDNLGRISHEDSPPGSVLAKSIPVSEIVRRYPLFDAIVTDPPFGIRERAQGSISPTAFTQRTGYENDALDRSTVSESERSISATHLSSEVIEGPVYWEYSPEIVAKLMEVASLRLRVGGRLVFWLPSPGPGNAATAVIRPVQSKKTNSVVPSHIHLNSSAPRSPNGTAGAIFECHDKSLSDNVNTAVPGFDIRTLLDVIESRAGTDATKTLRFSRATPQVLHDKLCRWLCVYVKTL